MKGKKTLSSPDRYIIIMAGGRGERFWPVSREATPKQLLPLLGGRSFLQQAVERVLPIVPARNILVITNSVQLPQVRKQLPKIPGGNIVAEPVGRDTTAAITLGAALVGARSTTAVMAVLPADHVIGEEKQFQQVLSDSLDLATLGQAIITIGIKPTEPSTAYGYIRIGATLPPPPGAKVYKSVFHRAEQFVEKPEYNRALEYLNSGQYRWNSGMFIKLPVTTTRGEALYEAVRALSRDGVKVNVTAIFTDEQVSRTIEAVAGGASACVSVFAGRLADLGIDYRPTMQAAVKQARATPNAEIIWASTREVFNVIEADQMGVHIITAPADVLKKMPAIGSKSAAELSLDAVKLFREDALAVKLSLKLPASRAAE